MRIGNDGFECPFDPIAIRIRNGQWRQELDRMDTVSRDLREDLVLLQQWNHDQLAKQTAARRFE